MPNINRLEFINIQKSPQKNRNHKFLFNDIGTYGRHNSTMMQSCAANILILETKIDLF